MTYRPITLGLASALLVPALFGCLERSDCQEGDFTQFMQANDAKSIEVLGLEYLSNAKMCTVGDFQIFGPANGSSGMLTIVKDGQMVFSRTTEAGPPGSDTSEYFSGISEVLWSDGIPIIALRDKDADDKFDWLSVEIHKDRYRDYLTVWDQDLDGQPDMRTQHSSQGPKTTWLWYEGSWRETNIWRGQKTRMIQVDGTWKRYKIENGEVTLLDDEQ